MRWPVSAMGPGLVAPRLVAPRLMARRLMPFGLMAFALMAFALAGCGSTPTRFYTLLTDGPTQPDMAWHGPPLKVGDVALPADLDRASLVTLGPGAGVQVSDTERWAAPLDQLVQRTLTDDLRSRLGDAAVLAPADPVPPGGARMIVLVVQRFSGDSGGHVVLAADWSVAGGNPPRPGPLHHVRIVESAGSTKGDAVADAMSRALGQLADDLCRAADLVGAPPSSGRG